jgi:predicted nucleic acid-binding protein
LFRSCLRTIGCEIVPLPERKSFARLAGLTSDKDLPVLASAVLGKADVLVTGDKRDLLKIQKHDLPFTVLSPAEFLDEYLPEWLKTL